MGGLVLCGDVLMQGGIYQLGGDYGEEGRDDAPECAMADEVFAYVDGDATPGDVVADYRAYVLLLLRGEKWQVHFGNDGEAAVDIDNTYEGLDTPRLIDVAPDAP